MSVAPDPVPAPVPPPPRERGALAPVAVIAAGLLLAVGGVAWGVSAPSAGADSGDGAAVIEEPLPAESPAGTAEEAAQAYLTHWAAGAWDEAGSSCATTSFAQSVDVVAQLSVLQAWTPESYLPATEPAFVELNTIRRALECQTILQTLLLNAQGSDVGQGLTVPIADAAAAQEYEADLDPAHLADVSVQRADVVVSSGGSGRFARNLEDWLGVYGVSAYAEVAVLLERGADTFTTSVMVGEYDSGWLVTDGRGVARGVGPGAFEPMTEAAYLASLEVGRS